MGRNRQTTGKGNKDNKDKPRSGRDRTGKPKKEEYNTEGGRKQSSVLKRNRNSRERIQQQSPAPRETRTTRTVQERTAGSVLSATGTAAQRWFYIVRHGGINNIRTKFVNELATYCTPRATKKAFESEDNENFNRYPDVVLHDHSRVVLKNGPEGIDYIHASHVKGAEYPMICAQGPVDASIDSFWMMVVEQNCGVIVQLCENQEEGREKCADYLPTEPAQFGDVTVTIKEPSHVTVANPSVRRTLLEASLSNGRSLEFSPFKVIHLLYDGWPDRDVPLSPAAFRQLRTTVHKIAAARRCTVLIHCSAGIGRTGTFAAIEMAYRDLIANDREVQMSTIFQRLRDQRALAIQTDLQYVFLHRALIDLALEKGRLNRTDKANGVDQFIKEYEELVQRKRKARRELERRHRRKRE
ncbi:hypothetical protein Mgra_00001884 [Meloidogyne graminicola]|uniref:Protein-tyrosine phosphatase n=1 Tax=Meloidogyne graminicola TaxID=189291 RepID=A0A8S9ZYP2_9BILA|nr:hypothetical protein Mgra_00001884 [Meloidogyne graminicola]